MSSRIPMWRRYARLFGADPAADVEEELRFHIEAKADDLVARGWRPDEARVEAIRQFGDLRRVQALGEQLGREREMSDRRRDYWGEFVQDLVYAFRTLRKEPTFAVISVLILALGIAANTAVFSVVNGVLLRPLPFANSDRLIWLRSDGSMLPELRATAGLSAVTYTVDAYEQFERHTQSFESVISYVPFFASSEYTMTGQGEPQAISGVMVSGNFFPTLGVQPVMGRLFSKEECLKGGGRAVLLSYSFWKNYFSSDPAVIGKVIRLTNQPVTVVGVLPEAFDFGSVFAPGQRMDVFVPAVMDEIRNWGNTLAIVGKLKPGVTLAQAQAESDSLFAALKQANPKWWGNYLSTLTGLQEYVSGKLRRSLLTLWSAVGLILLIVCVNLSNLQLARAAARTKEFAVRRALGAGKGRLVRQLLTESLVLVSFGSVLGLGLAIAGTAYLARQNSIALPLLTRVTVDGTALAWTLGIASATVLLFGLVPGLRLYATNVQDGLKSSGTGMTTGRRHDRLRASMVISEVALACVLLIGAGLLLRSFLKVLDIDLGFRPSQALVIKIDYRDTDNGPQLAATLQEILRNVTAIPGIESAGVTDMLPLGRNRSWGFRAKDRQYPRGSDLSAVVRIVTPGYLEAMGMRLRAGRSFTWADATNKEDTVVINEAAARLHYPDQDPIGRVAQAGSREGATIIGVIEDVRALAVETSATPEMYLLPSKHRPEGAELVFRTKLPLETIAPTLKRTLKDVNPVQPATEVRRLQEVVDRAVSPRRFFVMLVSGFAVVGLILASLGIYGVISYSVTQQTKEIGIRMALGASGTQVQTGVVVRALRLAFSGAVLGAIGSFIAARWIASLLFGTQPTDAVTFGGVMLLLCMVALFAGWLPARRASQIQPITALREG